MDNFIITTAGRRVEFQPVAQRLLEKVMALVEKDFRAAGEPLDPPWYWSIEPGPDGQGGEKIFWDAASVAKDGTEDEKRAWAKHQDAVTRLTKAREERATEVMLIKGIKNEDDRRPTPEWVKEQESFGIELPTDPQKLALEYIQTDILQTPFDLIQATKKVALLNLNGFVGDEEIASVEATFQDAMEEAARRFIGQGFNELAARNGATNGGEQVRDMELQPGEAEHEDSPVLGAEVTERMGRPD